MYSNKQFQIAQHKQTKIFLAIESIAVMVFALFNSIMLPQLLVQFLLSKSESQLFQQPPVWINYIPVVFFALGVAYFVYAVAAMFMLHGKISKLEKALESDGCGCCCDDDCCSSDMDSTNELAEIMATAEKVVAQAESKTTKNKTTKTRKSSGRGRKAK